MRVRLWLLVMPRSPAPPPVPLESVCEPQLIPSDSPPATDHAAPAERELSRLARIGIVGGCVALYAVGFLPLYGQFGRPAFSLSAVPTVIGGALLGLWGVFGTTAALLLANSQFVRLVHYPPEQVTPSAVLSTSASIGLGMGAAALVRLLAERRAANRRLAEEIRYRRTVEDALQRSARLHQALVESLGEGVALFDESGCCVYANRAAAQAIGVPLEELLGRPFAHFWDETTREHRRLAPTPDTEHRRYEVTLATPGGRVLLVTETCWQEDRAARGRTLCVFHDVTEHVELERQQRRLEVELERNQALQSLAVLAGGVAHDFNNLLSGVVGNAELALLKLPPATPPPVPDILRELTQFAIEAGQLSTQMLAYAGGRALSLKPTNLNAEVEQALRLLRTTIETGARLEVRLDPSLPELLADRVQIRQIVTNLVLNAMDAMRPKRGLLRVTTSTERREAVRAAGCETSAASQPGECAILAISDSGTGIAPEHLPRIFEPFFSTKAQGRGMGLAACMGIARGHRGWLEVESEPGVGTTFALLLPLARSAICSPSVHPVADASLLAGRTVLLIDDELAVRTVTKRLLEELRCRVLVQASGRAGIACFAEEQGLVDVVLLDLTMPDLSGIETLAELCALDPHVRVVLTSGFHPSDIADLLREPGVRAFLEKPHRLANLSAALQQAMQTPPLGQG